MSVINDLLSRRSLSTIPSHLWELRITEPEYEDLKTAIKEQKLNCAPEDAALYYAEWYRRESLSEVSKEKIASSLGLSSSLDAESFFDLALGGAKSLGLEIIRGNREWAFRSLLYQGGLPLNRYLNTTSDNNQAKRNFCKSLISSQTDFSGFDVGDIGNQSTSLAAFFAAIKKAINNESPNDLPVNQDDTSSLFKQLKDIVSKERKRYLDLNPIQFDWCVILDEIGEKIIPHYHVCAPNQLSKGYLEQQHLENDDIAFLTIDVDGESVLNRPYYQGYNQAEVNFFDKYNEGSTISIGLTSGRNSTDNECLLFDEPLLFYKENEYYILGNGLGKFESVLLIPDKWHLEEGVVNQELADYNLNGRPFKVLMLPENYAGTSIVVISDDNQKKEFLRDNKLYKTRIDYSDMCYNSILDCDLFQKEAVKVYITGKYEEDTKILDYEYRAKGKREWTKEPPIGIISIRPVNNNNSDILPANSIINLGPSFHIETSIIEGGDCEIKISWPEGKVEISGAQKQNANSWLVRMDNWNISSVKAVFIPEGNFNAPFTLSVNLPGKGLLLLDSKGNAISSGSILGINDFFNIKYLLDGDVIEFNAGARNDHYRLVRSKKNYMLYRNDRYERNIKRSNYINSLTGISSTEELLQATDSLLAKGIYEIKSRDITGSPYYVVFSLYKYELDDNDGIISIQTKGENEIVSIKDLLCLPSDHCESKPYELIVNDGKVEIPEDSGLKGHDLIIFDSHHLVEPYVFYTTENLDPVEEISIDNIYIGSEECNKLIKITDNIFNYSLPVNDIEQINPLLESKEGLMRLFLSKMLGYNSDTFKELLSLEMEFGFMWFWFPEDIEKHQEFLNIDDKDCKMALTLWGLANSIIADLSNIDYNEIKQSFLKFSQEKYNELRLASASCKDKIGVDRLISASEFSFNLLFQKEQLTNYTSRTISSYINGINLEKIKELARFNGADSQFVVKMARMIVCCMNGHDEDIMSDKYIDTRLAIVYIYYHYSTLMLMITNNLIINPNYNIN